MRWTLALAVLALAVPAQAQENEAEKLYRAFEKKLLAAKAFKFSFDIEGDTGRNITLKGDFTLAAGNKLKAVFEGKEGDKAMSGTVVSDGQTTGMKIIADGKPQSNTEATVDKLTEYIAGNFAIGGLLFAVERDPKLPDSAPDKLKLSGFKLGGKEKVGDRDAQVVEFSFEWKDSKASAKLWLDSKTQVPLKRMVEVKEGDKVRLRATEMYTNWQWEPKLKDGEFTLPK
jgi:outer membrane lipoprotein-sorting protein